MNAEIKKLLGKRKNGPVNKIVNRAPKTSTKIDTYLKWAPVGIMLAPNLFDRDKLKRIPAQLAIIFTAQGLGKAIVEPLKHSTDKGRPGNPLSRHSFPSGHTATAFVAAELLRSDQSDNSPLISWAGYGLAVTTGVIRICKRRHWLADVVSGAIIGITAARITVISVRKLVERCSGRNNDQDDHSL